MSKTNHTPEPWKTKENFILSADGTYVATANGKGTKVSEDRANAQRIIECVNAMAGIESPQKLRQTFEQVRFLKLDAYPELEKERNELKDWKKDAELAHKLMMEAFNKQTEILSGLLNEYKEFIADCEVPPSNTTFLSKVQQFINNSQNTSYENK